MGAVYLVRHGQASFGARDYDELSELGARQSAAVGEELRRRTGRITRVRCGTLRRQRDTAAAAGFDAIEDPRWNEYDHEAVLAAHAELGAGGNPGAAGGRVQEMLDGALLRWIAADGAGEASNGQALEHWSGFAARVTEALDELVAELNRGEDALVVTSGGVIGALVARELGCQADGFVPLHRVTCNVGITKFVTGRSGTSLVSFNEHGHLEHDAAALLTYR
ncbi:histidine phosphatase family protein [Haloechinothrix sp. LS1_15]|uniref:histidine phosphatase family protein n=1 Tax=Haloechinothrix sp. LS1_15 TaxID=2652248 RepID=UPI002944B22F|nr:histidine phosphatase family protein [Haloechinothrix sp. LS1_15]MDV6013699.1 histidine phosphatase family protein [Haloechinothrix sp. LS1_15]